MMDFKRIITGLKHRFEERHKELFDSGLYTIIITIWTDDFQAEISHRSRTQEISITYYSKTENFSYMIEKQIE